MEILQIALVYLVVTGIPVWMPSADPAGLNNKEMCYVSSQVWGGKQES